VLNDQPMRPNSASTVTRGGASSFTSGAVGSIYGRAMPVSFVRNISTGRRLRPSACTIAPTKSGWNLNTLAPQCANGAAIATGRKVSLFDGLGTLLAARQLRRFAWKSARGGTPLHSASSGNDRRADRS
jgi:hypothetical protein